MKAYTDLKQSRKLAKILPIESADMVFTFSIKEDTCVPDKYPSCRKYSELYKEFVSLGFSKEHIGNLIYPCWSLAALLGVINKDYYTALYHDGVAWNFDVTHHDNETDKHNTFADTPVDACVEMINKLHEQKIL